MEGTIGRLGVVARGEVAVRIINAAHGLGADAGAPVTAVLLSRDGDLNPWYGREADEVVPLLPERAEPAPDEVVAVLQQARIDTIWLGPWPAADRAELVEACALGGIVVVGPTASTLAQIADRARLAAVAARAGLTLVEGDPDPCRRLDVDVLADGRGTMWVLGCRDVTVCLGGELLLAEAPCPFLGDQAERATAAAAEVARQLDYRGAGVISFVYDGAGLGLLGVDPVAPPGHATTEERTGTSIIAARLRVARGEALDPDGPVGEGVAMEARVRADVADVAAGPPAPVVALVSFPVGTGVRVDANRRPGDEVPADDPVLAVVTAWGADRRVAIERLRRALERTSIVVDGAATNRSLLLDLLRRPEIADGPTDSGWVEALLAAGWEPASDPVALLAAAVESYEADRALAQEAFFETAGRGRPEQPDAPGALIELGYRGHRYGLQVFCTGPRRYSIHHGRTVADVVVDVLDRFERRITCGGRRHRVVVSPLESALRVELDGTAHVIERADGLVVRAGWPALVVEALVSPGDQVVKGTPVAVLESMKMETTVTAPFDGEVVSVAVSANAQIERGAPLLRIRRRTSGAPPAAAGEPVVLAGLDAPVDFTRRPCDRVYDPLDNYLLGYDMAPPARQRLLVQQRRLAEIAEPGDEALMACEDGLLDVFADIGALYRPSAESDPDDPALTTPDTQEHLLAFLQWLDADRAGLPADYRALLLRALDRFGVRSLDRSAELESALMWIFRSLARVTELSPIVVSILQRRLRHREALAAHTGSEARARLERLVSATQGRQQVIADLARDVVYHFFDEPPLRAAADAVRAEMVDHLAHLAAEPGAADREARIARLVWCPHPMGPLLMQSWTAVDDPAQQAAQQAAMHRAVLEVYVRRFYRVRHLGAIRVDRAGGLEYATCDYEHDGHPVRLVVAYARLGDVPAVSTALAGVLTDGAADRRIVVDLVTWRDEQDRGGDIEATAQEVAGLVARARFGRRLHRLDVTVHRRPGGEGSGARAQNVTFRQGDDGAFTEETLYRNLHPMLAKRLELWRFANFELERRPAPDDVYLFLGVARTNPSDRRLFALAEIRHLTAVEDPATGLVGYPDLERTGMLAMAAIRSELGRYTLRDRPAANRIVVDVRSPWTMPVAELLAGVSRYAPLAASIGLQKMVLKVQVPDAEAPGGSRDTVLHLENVGGQISYREDRAGEEPIHPLSAYRQKVLTAARFGSPYPYEILKLFTQRGDLLGDRPLGRFVELDLDEQGELAPVTRPPGTNTAHVVVGLLTNPTDVVPEGMERVAILSDPTQGLGNLAEPECARVNAALALALERRIPVEWFAVSSGALIAMDSGTENMDWIALTLRRLIEYTQAGGEVNIVVTGINVGGQPYWNAEATMLMHTKGILVMTPASAMVLTGKQALDFSGAVSAEDNRGIGGYERVMGPNGQAQYWAPSFVEACSLLLRHYELTYVVPGESRPRRRPSTDPVDRDVRSSPHPVLADSPFTTVGGVFSADLNADRKQPFDMRAVMRAVADADVEPLERWRHLRDGDTSIVWDATIGGFPVCLLGIESHTVTRPGFVPADGPPAWTSGTLFPHSSRKTARAINAASGRRPLVVLANLSGFDGSPESMRRRQLEFGAEIGRAVTNFAGPIVFVVVSRYHGGAFVVFSKALNEQMEIAAVEGSFASVIGGAPAAATVFAREVRQRTDRDPRVRALRDEVSAADGAEAAALRARLADVTARVHAEKLGAVADEFDSIHTIERALRVGSVDRIIAAADLRPYVVDALERHTSGSSTHE